MLHHIRQFRSLDPSKNLEIELYTNGTYLDEKVASAMEGVVDLVAVTIDSAKDQVLTEIGRNNKKFNRYYENAIRVCQLLSTKGIRVKLHSVVGTKTYQTLPDEVAFILDSLETRGVRLACWKFYQYMSYDLPEKDQMHGIPADYYQQFQEKVETALAGRQIPLHFKDNEEMNASLFNILSYGNAQYMRDGDTWTTSQRTRDLRSYDSMSRLFSEHDIDEQRFRHLHELAAR